MWQQHRLLRNDRGSEARFSSFVSGNVCDLSFQSLPPPLCPFPSFFPFGAWRHIVLISFVMNMRPYDIKTILFKKWGTSRVFFSFSSSPFLLSAGFRSSLALCFICRLEWQVGLEMLTVFQMLSFFMIFFGSVKIKATTAHILQPTPNVLEVKEAFHYIFCWPRAVLIALLYCKYSYVIFLAKSYEWGRKKYSSG